MKRSISIASLATLLVAFAAVLADTKADFSGKWTMDTAKTEGLPAGLDQIMTVSQKGDQITLETKVMPPDQPAFTISAVYSLDGKEAEFTQPTQNGDAKGKRIAKWVADGRGIEVNEVINIDTPQGAATVKINRKWALSADGKTLTIDIDQSGPNGDFHSKRVFNKA
ncbi:MAG TPA: hypothetical protein VID27_02480 [Blastocatellia bacterium]|jgi:hypothetical protein